MAAESALYPHLVTIARPELTFRDLCRELDKLVRKLGFDKDRCRIGAYRLMLKVVTSSGTALRHDDHYKDAYRVSASTAFRQSDRENTVLAAASSRAAIRSSTFVLPK
jgi:hypothetical protein